MVGHAVSGRSQLKEYCLRRLGFPVLEINVDDDQIEDLIDDAIQYFNERHYNGIERVFLKHKITIEEKEILEGTNSAGITTTTASSMTLGQPAGIGVTTVAWEESNNFLYPGVVNFNFLKISYDVIAFLFITFLKVK